MPNQTTRWVLPVTLFLNSLALTITGLFATAANAEFQSTTRAAMVVVVFALAALMFAGSIWYFKNPNKGEQFCQKISAHKYLTAINLGIGLLFALTWGLAWLPAEKSGSLYYYFIGIQPLLGWLAFASGLALILSLSLRPDFSIQSGLSYWREQKTTWRISLVVMVLFALLAALIIWLKIWASGEPYWYGAGVPLLAWQVYVLLLAAVLLRQIHVRWPRYADTLIFLVVWAISAWFWAGQPLQASFFFTPPLFPNHEFYPFADLEFFDRSSQYAMIGQGINNGQFFDRSLYIAFLVYLHTFSGENYETLMSIQAGLFAVFPAVVYLIGKNLHSRPAGMFAAALASWRGVNALTAMALINTSTAKHMLTDFPTGLGLAIFCLFLVEWLKDPQKQWHKAAWAAGTLGLTSLLRPHVMAILLVFMAGILLVYLPRWRRGLAIASLGLLAFFASITPWVFFSGSDVSVIDLYATRIRGVIDQRYRPPEQEQIPALPAKPGLLALAFQTGQPIEVPFAVNHFLNNLQTSAFGLPVSPQLISLRETTKDTESVWQTAWGGDLSPRAAVMLSLGLALAALGIGAATQKSTQAGMALPAVFVVYAGANALARTSGGRYIVPIDWILFLFLGLGLWVLVETASMFFKRQANADESAGKGQPAANAQKNAHWAVKASGVIIAFGLIGGLIPLAQELHPPRYQRMGQEALLGAIGGFLPQLGIQRQAAEAFLQDKNAVILQGMALYPRFFAQGEGVPSWKPYSRAEYPRTIFVLIGPQAKQLVMVLPGLAPERLPHKSDVIVLACKRENINDDIFDALVVVLPGEELAYAMQPQRPLQCPVAEPLCNNNKTCR